MTLLAAQLEKNTSILAEINTSIELPTLGGSLDTAAFGKSLSEQFLEFATESKDLLERKKQFISELLYYLKTKAPAYVASVWMESRKENAAERYIAAYREIISFMSEEPKIEATAFSSALIYYNKADLLNNQEPEEKKEDEEKEDEEKEQPGLIASFFHSASEADKKIQALIPTIKNGTFTQQTVEDAFQSYYAEHHKKGQKDLFVLDAQKNAEPTYADKHGFLSVLLNPTDTHASYQSAWDINTANVPTKGHHYSLFIKYFLSQSASFYSDCKDGDHIPEYKKFSALLQQYTEAKKILLSFANNISEHNSQAILSTILGENLISSADYVFADHAGMGNAHIVLLLTAACEDKHWDAAYQIMTSRHFDAKNLNVVLGHKEAKQALLQIATEHKNQKVITDLTAPVQASATTAAAITTIAIPHIKLVVEEQHDHSSSASSSSADSTSSPATAIGLQLPEHPIIHTTPTATTTPTKKLPADASHSSTSNAGASPSRRVFGAVDPHVGTDSSSAADTSNTDASSSSGVTGAVITDSLPLPPPSPSFSEQFAKIMAACCCAPETLLKAGKVMVGAALVLAGIGIAAAAICASIESLGFSLPLVSVGKGFIAAGLSLIIGAEILHQARTGTFWTPSFSKLLSCGSSSVDDAKVGSTATTTSTLK